jgi:hypothetical protein
MSIYESSGAFGGKSVFTDRQKEALTARIAHAIIWANAQSYQRDDANRQARAIVRELDGSQSADMAVRRSLVKIVEKVEEAG